MSRRRRRRAYFRYGTARARRRWRARLRRVVKGRILLWKAALLRARSKARRRLLRRLIRRWESSYLIVGGRR